MELEFQSVVFKTVTSRDRLVFFFSGTPVSSTNKTDRNDITETLLKVALNTLTLSLKYNYICI